jgi:hypothetical protein
MEQREQRGPVLGQTAALCQPLGFERSPSILDLSSAQPGRGGDAPGPQQPLRIGEDLQKISVRRRQYRLRKARPPRRRRQHPIGGRPTTREPADAAPAAAARPASCPPPALARARPAEDLRDRFPGDLPPGQPLLGSRQPLIRPRDLSAAHPSPGGMPPHADAILRSTNPSDISSLLPETEGDDLPACPASPHLPGSASPCRRATPKWT